MIKRLFGYIVAAAVVAVLVYTVLGRNGYTSFRPHAGNSENVVENSGGKTSSILVNRIFVVAVGLIALVLALKVPSVTQILMYGYSVYVPGLLLPVIAGSFNWKISDRAMLATIMVGVAVAVILILMGEPFPGALGGLIASAVPFVIGLVSARNKDVGRA